MQWKNFNPTFSQKVENVFIIIIIVIIIIKLFIIIIITIIIIIIIMVVEHSEWTRFVHDLHVSPSDYIV